MTTRSTTIRTASVGTALLVAVIALSAACGGGQRVEMLDGAEGSPAYLAAAADRSTSESYRFEQEVDVAIPGTGADDVPLVSGEVDGTRAHVRTDLRGTFDAMAAMAAELGEEMPDLSDADLVVETIIDGSVAYLRAPLFGALGSLDATAELGPLAALGDGWVHVDVGALDDMAPVDVAGSVSGIDAADPSAMVDLVREADEVVDLGRRELRGDAVAGLGAELTLRDLLVAQGADTSMMLSDAYTDVVIPVEAWIDADGYVRQVIIDVDVAAVASTMGPEVPMEGFNLTTSIELFDHGDPSISVSPPSESLDLTDVLAALLATAG